MRSIFVAALLLASAGLFAAARAEPASLNSHEVHADGSVTFRYYGPAAQHVALSLDYDPATLALQRSGDNIWSVTTPPLQPALHFYTFSVDGVSLFDPRNPAIEPNLVFTTNLVRVPGTGSQPWDLTRVAHGVLHRHVYSSAVIKGLADGHEEYFVYTPPGYDAAGPRHYPVLYLLHGWSALADDWVAAGQADLILDNLIAQGRAAPMVVVMPQSYGTMAVVRDGFKSLADPKLIEENVRLFSDALFKEIAPQVERAYRVSGDRAIAGVSMGGGQSLRIGLTHPEYFGWVGAFSPGVDYPSFDGIFSGMPAHGPTWLLWIACGTDDALIAPTRKLVTWLKSHGVTPTAVETPGIHNWQVWRDNLVHFLPLLFGQRIPPGAAATSSGELQLRVQRTETSVIARPLS